MIIEFLQIQIPTDRTSGTRTRATQMLTNTIVEKCSKPLTTAPRRLSIPSRHNLYVVDVILVSPRYFLNFKVGTTCKLILWKSFMTSTVSGGSRLGIWGFIPSQSFSSNTNHFFCRVKEKKYVTVPWGRRYWVGINFCHPEVVKLQQQCHMHNTILGLPPNWLYSFFFWERESSNISWRQQQENWKEK